MVAIPTLETGRLRLRGYRLGDFDAYFEMFADPAVVRFLGGTPFDREQSWARFMRHVGVWHHLGFGYWAIEDRATGALAGECGFQDMQRGLAPSLDGSMEAGWALARPFQGRGLAEEAMRACLAWAEQHGPRERLTAIIDPEHVRSRRLAARLGFTEMAQSHYRERPICIFGRPRRALSI